MIDLEAIEARLKDDVPACGTAEHWAWRTQVRDDLRSLVREVRELRMLCGTVQQEGAGTIDPLVAREVEFLRGVLGPMTVILGATPEEGYGSIEQVLSDLKRAALERRSANPKIPRGWGQ